MTKPRNPPSRPRTRGKVMGVPVKVRLQPEQVEIVDRHRAPGMSRADVIRDAISRMEERPGG